MPDFDTTYMDLLLKAGGHTLLLLIIILIVTFGVDPAFPAAEMATTFRQLTNATRPTMVNMPVTPTGTPNGSSGTSRTNGTIASMPVTRNGSSRTPNGTIANRPSVTSRP